MPIYGSLTRRQFLLAGGIAAGGLPLGACGASGVPGEAIGAASTAAAKGGSTTTSQRPGTCLHAQRSTNADRPRRSCRVVDHQRQTFPNDRSAVQSVKDNEPGCGSQSQQHVSPHAPPRPHVPGQSRRRRGTPQRHRQRVTHAHRGGRLRPDNPGQWVVHCHDLYHQQAGMMSVLSYRT